MPICTMTPSKRMTFHPWVHLVTEPERRKSDNASHLGGTTESMSRLVVTLLKRS